jgi:hypothetical protein
MFENKLDTSRLDIDEINKIPILNSINFEDILIDTTASVEFTNIRKMISKIIPSTHNIKLPSYGEEIIIPNLLLPESFELFSDDQQTDTIYQSSVPTVLKLKDLAL